MPENETDNLGVVFAYHQRTKHQRRAMAAGPGGLDWANQPDPFRRYEGAPQIRLAWQGFSKEAPASSNRSSIAAALSTPLNLASISQLFFESLALSGRKAFAGSSWSLRVNPSSGNLHPIEAYLIAGPLACYPGNDALQEDDLLKDDARPVLHSSPALYHYAPQNHSLELLALISGQSWQRLGLARDTLLLAFSSICWRQSWKYGERAFRYCMLDAGHALAAVALAAGCLGWRTMLQDGVSGPDLAALMGLNLPGRPLSGSGEDEHPVMLLSIFTGSEANSPTVNPESLSQIELQPLPSRANHLSPQHIHWPAIDLVEKASVKPPAQQASLSYPSSSHPSEKCGPSAIPDRYRSVLRRRRSAQAMDASVSMPLSVFHSILRAIMPKAPPMHALPWQPCIQPVFFVHRVEDLDAGLYILLRDGSGRDEPQDNCEQEPLEKMCKQKPERVKRDMQQAMREDYIWQRPSRMPEDLPLYLLDQGDSRISAKATSCRQDIASDGCFAVAMIARFAEPLKRSGPWFYPRLFWECGAMGQALYLAAEAGGFQGCGIGCFLDDMVHDMLGLCGPAYQDLYHFTVGRALLDPRILNLPAYE